MDARHIFHVYIKETQEHRYFGSSAAVCEAYTKRQIGIRGGRIRAWFSHNNFVPFENDFCVIRKGFLERKAKPEK
ncbi:MAG: hypothetical protein AB2L20_14910 [Mangrovibacterium sp.]